MNDKYIRIQGARENNLKNIDVNIKRNSLTVLTGVSGSGKSSLAFDVLYAEGQRQLLDSLSSSSRIFASQLKKPDVDLVSGLSAVIAIEQKTGVTNPRSTVATMSDIYDYLRLLFATTGTFRCLYCDHETVPLTIAQIRAHLLRLPESSVVEAYAPVYKPYGESEHYLFSELRKKGYRKFIVDDEPYDSATGEPIPPNGRIEAVIGRLTVHNSFLKTAEQVIGDALKLGNGVIRLEVIDAPNMDIEAINAFLAGFSCPEHHLLHGELSGRDFSSNESSGACPVCEGLGSYPRVNPAFICRNKKKTVEDMLGTNMIVHFYENSANKVFYDSLAKHYGFTLDTPISQLSHDAVNILLYGTKGDVFQIVRPQGMTGECPNEGSLVSYEGIIADIEKRYKHSRRPGVNVRAGEEMMFKKTMTDWVCDACQGKRLLEYRLHIYVSGKNIHEIGEMPLLEAFEFFRTIQLPAERQRIAEPINKEILSRLLSLVEMGLGYLSLNRRAVTLSGGEAQRIRVCHQISSELVGVVYVLDEPSIGLHASDVEKIINMLRNLQRRENTVDVVEHDVDIIQTADSIIELGPRAGQNGGEIIAQGTINDIILNQNSLLGDYLTERKAIKVPQKRRAGNGQVVREYAKISDRMIR